MRHFTRVASVLLLLAQTAYAEFQLEATPVSVQLSSKESGISLEITSRAIDPAIVNKDGHTYQAFTIPGEGTTFERDRPILPSISRFIIVDPIAGIEFVAESDPPVVIKASAPPALCDEELVLPTPGEMNGLYPPNFAEMSDPVIIRGVRMVKVTTFPYQYDATTGNFLYRNNINTEIRYNNSVPINPVANPNRPHRSPEFRKFIEAFAENGDELFRDDPDYPVPYVGHYLVVANIDALLWHLPFIEWRRKAGYKMEILALSNNDALNTNTVKNAIRARYNQYVNAGLEPFDQLLLIGDRNGYDNLTIAPDKQLAAERGETIWGGPDHADYKYALLEGDDNLPDVSFGRFPSGSQGVAGLVVGRTLAYEMTPRMNNPQWFTRGLNYSQHWGNGVESAWHITIPTNARWGEEVLQSLGFDDVNFYEDFAHDQQGASIGPVIRDELNAGSNLMVGRAENYFWRGNFQGVNNNTVFPINICVSGHGEWTAWNMFRTGDGNNLKGPVAATFGWGGPPTASSSYTWMQMVNGTCLKDMTLGWSRMYAITSIENYFQNINVGQSLYTHVKTDIDMHGDPGIRPWFGVPRLLEVSIPQSVSPDVGLIEAVVTTVQGDEPAPGVQVTLYHQGNMVLNNAAQYAGFNDHFAKIAFTDEDGRVRFAMDDVNLIAGKTVFVTVTGRDVRPVLGEIAVAIPRAGVEVSDFSVIEVEGNGDDIANPDEVIDVSIFAKNIGNRDAVAGVTAIVTSLSDYLTVEDNELSFGDLAVGGEAEADALVRVTLSPHAPDSESRPAVQPRLQVTFFSGQTSWTTILNLPVEAPHLILLSIPGGNIVQTRATGLNFDLKNVGSRGSGAITGRLSSQGIGVSVIRDSAVWPAIADGNHATIQGNQFSVAGNLIAVPGSKCPMRLVLTTETGFRDTISFELQVSTPRANAPQGPDKYGYLAFDDTDQDWEIAPSYDWEEINPNDNDAEFDGTLLNFRWQGEIGETVPVILGFETQFYGKRYDRITVASNGFISMGSQPRISNHQNWPLDQAIGGGVGMIAPLWDDLDNGQGSGIYSYYDEETGRHIIEWYRMRGINGNPEFTFQVILYDPEIWRTESGDPNILFQYKTVSENANIRNGDQEYVNNIAYASVGISSPDGKTGLSYHFHGDGPVTSADLAARRAILFATAPRFKNGVLYGTVTAHPNGEPLANATIFTQHGFVATTDEEGYYRIPGAAAEVDFLATCRKSGYNDSTLTELWIEEDDSLELNFSLLHPEFVPSIERIDEGVSADEIVESEFTVTNTGNGTLTWQVSRRLIGDADAEPWDLRRSFDVTRITNDSRIQGVVFVEDRFYFAGANGGLANMIWVFDRDGALLDSFEQHGASNFGYKDLEYDGELIWGSGEETVFGFTPEGELVKEWNSHLNPAASYVAWNEEDGILYLCGTTTDIYRFDRDGNNLGEEINVDRLRIYGLAYWKDDPNDHPLYIINQPALDSTTNVEKLTLDPQNPDKMEVVSLEMLPDGDPRIGAYITNEFDVYSWVFLTLTNQPPINGGDRLEIYQLDARRDWFDVRPISGILEAGEEQVFDFTFNSSGLPSVMFQGELLFSHNASENLTLIPVSLDVQAGPGRLDRRTLQLTPGWNMVSLNVTPEVEAIPELVAPLVELDFLRLVKDGQGRFYRPDNNFNNIPRWDPSHGYLLYLDQAAELTVRGVVIAPDEPIQLNAGWNLRSYYPRESLDVRLATESVVESLLMVKDGSGRFYMPALNFSNMVPMEEGRGYYFRASAAAQLVYPPAEERLAAKAELMKECSHFQLTTSDHSSANHSLLVIGSPAFADWEIAAKSTGNTISGIARFDSDGRAGLAVWGDDPNSPAIDGAVVGDKFELVVWDGENESTLSISRIDYDQNWIDGGMSILAASGLAPVEFGLAEAYPNPFNSSVRLSYGIVESGRVKLAIFDALGRQIAVLSDGNQDAGFYKAVWQANALPNGIYFARLDQAGKTDVRKLMLMK